MIPGVPLPDGVINPLYDYDFGPQFHYNDLAGVIAMPAAADQAGASESGSERGRGRQ